MKNVLTIFGFLTLSFAAGAADIPSTVSSELAAIEIQEDFCKMAISTNKLIALGEPAVGALSEALNNPNVGLKAKWSAAEALGEIGSTQGIPALNEALRSDNGWLRDTAKHSISIINGEVQRAGKVYLMSYGQQVTKTDCEAGTVEILK